MSINQNKNINYLNKDFTSFKQSLTDFAKTYFSQTYNDFSPASPGMMFIEMASYVGDVLSFYLDTQFQENLLLYTKQRENIMSIAYALGYRPQMSYASTTTVDIYQLIPIKIVDSVSLPDWNYGITIPENTQLLSASSDQKFLTTAKVDFSDETADVSLFNDAYFLAKKSVGVISGEIKTITFDIGSPTKFLTITISDSQIINVISMVDGSTNNWYEVPFLAQETIIDKTPNPTYLSDGVPFLGTYKKAPRRFVTRFKSNGDLDIQFGAGTSTFDDTQILPTPDNIQLGLVPTVSGLENNFNKASIFFAKEYGVAPSNTTLTIQYVVGGGIGSNVPSNDITRLGITIDTTNFSNGITISDPFYTPIITNITITNPTPAVGGRDGDTIEEIRLNTLNSFSAQDRAVTKQDYMVRALSLPPDLGSIAKVYASQDAILSPNIGDNPLISGNPLAISLYVLGYDSDKKLQMAPVALKNNLKSYLTGYRMVTDAINIRNAFIVNIGINFDITVVSGFNNREILTLCLNELQDFFNIDKWQINQPIKISDIHTTLLKIKGVQSVTKIEIFNKQGGNYSQFGYDVSGATRNNIVYPSVDPSIFEVKFLDQDIQGRVVTL